MKKYPFVKKSTLFVLFALFGVTPSISLAGFKDGQDASRVLGQPDFNSSTAAISQTGLNEPSDVAIDPTTGKVFVADRAGSRVLRYSSFDALIDGAPAEAVLGEVDFDTGPTAGTSATTLRGPIAVVVDSAGSLFVADENNQRVVRYDLASAKGNGAAADGVLGAPDLDTVIAGVSNVLLNQPWGLAIDAADTLYVCDSGNDRVVRFKNARNLPDGAAADGVFGQPNFDTNGDATTATGMRDPRGLAVDASERLWVADQGNHRILRFDNAFSKGNGSAADGVLGQASFTEQTQSTAANRFSFPWGVAFDKQGNIWVSEEGNNRLVRYNNPASKTLTGAEGALEPMNADGVLGQENLTTSTPSLAQNRVIGCRGICIDADGNLFVADTDNNRVMIFVESIQPDFKIGLGFGSLKGDDIYSLTGAGQKATRVVRKGRKGKVFASVENDGADPDTFSIRGNGSNRKFRISHFRMTGGRINISGAVRLGNYDTAALAATESEAFTIEVKAKGRFRRKRAVTNLSLSATSDTDNISKDLVKGKVRNKP